MIRKWKDQDFEQILRIWLEGNKEAHDFIPQEYWEQNLPFLRQALSQADVYVYEAEGQVQGFVGMQDTYLAGIFVKKQFRMHGIGKQLLNHVKSIHPILVLNVYQKNKRAVAFYQREGFLILSKGVDENTGEADFTMCWKKKAKKELD